MTLSLLLYRRNNKTSNNKGNTTNYPSAYHPWCRMSSRTQCLQPWDKWCRWCFKVEVCVGKEIWVDKVETFSQVWWATWVPTVRDRIITNGLSIIFDLNVIIMTKEDSANKCLSNNLNHRDLFNKSSNIIKTLGQIFRDKLILHKLKLSTQSSENSKGSKSYSYSNLQFQVKLDRWELINNKDISSHSQV